MVSKKSLRVGLYLRVSTKDQTVENQRLELEQLAQHRGWHIVETYTDSGISGAKGRDKRPAFDRMCRDAQRGKLDIVAAWAIDRIGRSVAHVAQFINELAEQKVALYLHQQGVDGTTPSGKAMLSMCSVFAEFERAMLIERIHAGLSRARAQGKKLGPKVRPLGPDTIAQIRVLRAQKVGIGKIARQFGIGVSKVSRVLAA